jgi:TM2 domain-containing membrane protein YozV
MKIFYLKYFILFFLLGPSSLICQETLEEQYQYSLRLFNQEKYFDAITELKRLNYFDKEKTYAYQSNLTIGKAYKEGAKYSDALRYFTLAEINAVNDSDLFKAKVFTVRVNILRRTTDQVLNLLNQLQKDKRFKNRGDEINYWRGWTYIFADEWNNAAKQFADINTNHPLKILCDKAASDMYNVTAAKVLSYIIPGAGQFYTGHYFSGLLSLGWNALWGYLTVKAFIDERVFDGLIIGNFLWLRFYVGNIQNAEKFANEANIKIANKALSYLQDQYKGEKP